MTVNMEPAPGPKSQSAPQACAGAHLVQRNVQGAPFLLRETWTETTRRILPPLPHPCFVLRYALLPSGFALRAPRLQHMIPHRKGDRGNAELDEARSIEVGSNGVGGGGFAQVG
jgi:hypothetical protein